MSESAGPERGRPLPPPPRPGQKPLPPLPVVVGPRRVLAWGERVRMLGGALLAATGVCFGAPISAPGLLLALLGLVAAGAIIRPTCRADGQWRFPPVDVVTASGLWAGVSLPLWVLNVGNLTVLAFLAWMVVTGLVVLLIVWAVFTRWRHAVVSVAIVAGLVASVAVLSPFELTFRRWQLRLAETALRSEMDRGDSYWESQGVHGWIWVGGIPDGGAGVAYDPTDRVVDDDFAVEVWHAITGDPGHCELLYDHWYWCK